MAYLESTGGQPFSTNQAITATAASTNLFDVTGAGSGNSPAMIGANGVNTALGFDIGAGQGAAEPRIQLSLGTVTTATGTLTIQVQAAPDNGSYSPGTYVTLYQSAALTGTSQLFAGESIELPIPAIPPGLIANGVPPRFYRINYVVTGSISLIVATAALSLGGTTLRDTTLYGANFPGGL